jgi:hypothetical protein
MFPSPSARKSFPPNLISTGRSTPPDGRRSRARTTRRIIPSLRGLTATSTGLGKNVLLGPYQHRTDFLPQLGVFAPLAALGAWVIIGQRNTIQAKDKRIDELTQIVIDIAKNDAKTATELTLAVRALHP